MVLHLNIADMIFTLIAPLALLPASASAATCYGTNGVPLVASPKFNVTPCDPSAQVSVCCNSLEAYCLSNGLCFDAQSNNGLGVTGCTDPNWSAPCHNYCPGKSRLRSLSVKGHMILYWN
jgi:hypothetical protein